MKLENQIQRASDYNLIRERIFTRLTADTIEVRKMLIGLRNRVDGKSD